MQTPTERAPAVLVAWYAAAVGSLAIGPWMALLLTDAGFAARTVPLLLVVLPTGRLFGGPLWAFLADRFRAEPVLRSGAVIGVLASIALLLVDEKWAVFVAVSVWALSRAPVFPIVDATTVALVGRRYGQVRAVGSVGFLVAAGLGGALRDRWTWAPVAIATVLAGATLLLTWRLPTLARGAAPPALRDLARLLRDPWLAGFALSTTLHGAGLAVYDSLFAVRIGALGLSSGVTGLAIAWAVGLEVALMALAPALWARFDPRTVLLASMAAGVPRLFFTGTLTDPVQLVLLQGLHALHFAAFWLAGTALLAERASAELRNSTQALLPATAFGAGPLLGLGLAGVLLGETATAEATGALFRLASLLAAGALLVAWRTTGREPRSRPPG